MTLRCLLSISLLQLLVTAVAYFPGSEDPRTADPPLPHSTHARMPCARVTPVKAANLSGYSQVVRVKYEPPRGLECSCARSDRVGHACWEQVVLELDGSVRGVQFDRYGAVWLRGVELLRTTTPEPSPEGIAWHVERDVSGYEQLFQSEGELMVAIPNVVDATYTGVLHVNISIVFYSSVNAHPLDSPAVTILPLKSNISQVGNPLSFLSKNGPAGQVNLLRLPNSSLGPVLEARLDVFASGHGCEEFWYTNVPGTNVPPGACGGGSYREIQIFVDGNLAGSCFPFPVIYTGGVNPLLWRPLTGMLSFDVAPYEFDLTPFVGLLSDGHEHNITLQVWGNNPQGFWILDGVLRLRHGLASQSVRGWKLDVALHNSTPNVSETVSNQSQTQTLQQMNGRHGYEARGQLYLEDGSILKSAVSGQLVASSTNRAIGSSTQVTEGWLRSTRISEQGGHSVTTLVDYPFYVFDFGAQDNTSLLLNASVRYGRNVTTAFQRDELSYMIGIHNSIQSSAVYNRSLLNHSRVNLEASQSDEHFELRAGRKLPCYEKHLQAINGSITGSRARYNCTWPHGVYACGGSLCGHFEAASAQNFHGLASPETMPRPGFASIVRSPPGASARHFPDLLLTARRPGGGASEVMAAVKKPRVTHGHLRKKGIVIYA
eukprot:TRINITY_DN105515_c0_g1_i1.p1 TRINITY_DN105515_c0_g1~~TRINITY_DN105515_c0_g1_i1.p1  ORF type:complete len:659 (-),score=88.82 TRINITY_DN105515_c0_g1_i1:24-2000(-)